MDVAVLRAGAYTTLQDAGRPGWQHDGVPPGGAMDPAAHHTANWLAGNRDDCATLECTLSGPVLRFMHDTVVAVTGADMTARVDDRPLAAWHAARVDAGSTLALAGARTGCRAYVAVAGGFAVPQVLGSRATFARAALGGYGGRRLRRGDGLALGDVGDAPPAPSRGIAIARFPALATQQSTVRLIAGPWLQQMDADSRERFTGDAFTVAAASDRMGVRLTGAALRLTSPVELLSAGVAMGTVQLPPDGHPIILMADRQTTGGYPRLGEIVAADHGIVAQKRPGDTLRFAVVTIDEAEQLHRDREAELAWVRRALLG